jgi:hypothetical protein
MHFCIEPDQLRKALADVERAEKNGFMHCQAVFKMVSAGDYLGDCKANYSDLSERAHPTDGNFNWGRFQNVSVNNTFKNGKLIPIKKNKP